MGRISLFSIISRPYKLYDIVYGKGYSSLYYTNDRATKGQNLTVKSIIKGMLTLLIIRCRYAFKSTADTVIGIHIVLWETIMQQFFQSGATKIEE